MEFKPQEQAVIDLLAKLKNANGGYPSDLMKSRRNVFLRQVANVSMGLGVGMGLQQATKKAKAGAGASIHAFTATSLLEIVLVAAIIVEAGVVAYNYRARIADFLSSFSSTPVVEEVVPPVAVGSPLPGLIITESVTPVVVVSETMTETATSVVSQPGESGGNGNNAAATPDPNEGNHYGQTKVPVPTREDKVNDKKN
jgi:hypothetical protein